VDRQSLLDFASMAPIPVAQDIAGLLADANYYYENPDELTLTNAAISVAGLLPLVPSKSQIRFAKNVIDSTEKVYPVDMNKLDELWSRTNQYVGKGGESKELISKERYDKFGDFLQKGIPVHAPNISVSSKGVTFGDGRHRTAFLRDIGLDVIPVAMDSKSAKEAMKKGLLIDNNPLYLPTTKRTAHNGKTGER